MYFYFLSSYTISCLQLSVHILPACYYTSLPPANEGYVFTRVCHSVHRGGVCPSACWDAHTPPRTRGRHPPRPEAGNPPGPEAGTPPGAVHAGRYGQQAGGTHPTRMHSCFLFMLLILGTKVLYQSHINGEFHQLMWD